MISPDTPQPSPASCNKWTLAEAAPVNKAQIIVELENMVVARLFNRQPWLADPETCSAVHRKLLQMGLVERVRGEPETWQCTPLGKELNVDLFEVFMGVWSEWDVPMILEDYHLLDDAEAEALYARMDKADAETVLSGYVRRAYFDYRKAAKFLH